MASVDHSATIGFANAQPASTSYAHPGGAIIAILMCGAGAGKRTVSSITFNGNAPDSVVVNNATGSDAEVCIHAVVWNNVAAVTANLACTLSNPAYGSIRLYSISGHDTSTPVQSSNHFTAATGTSYSNQLTSLAASSLVVDMIGLVGDRTSTLAEDVSQTELGSPDFQGAWVTTGASYEVGDSTVTMSWTWTTGVNRNHVLIALANAAGGGGGNANLLVGKFGALLKGKLS